MSRYRIKVFTKNGRSVDFAMEGFTPGPLANAFCQEVGVTGSDAVSVSQDILDLITTVQLGPRVTMLQATVANRRVRVEDLGRLACEARR